MDIRITKHRINVIIWFLKRPKLYKQLLRELIRFLNQKQHPTLERSVEAEKWCGLKSISNVDAMEILEIEDPYEIKVKYKFEFDYAYKVANLMDFDWGGEGNGMILYHLAKKLNAVNILETGVAYGWSSLSFLLYLNDINEGKLTSIDMPFFNTLNDDDVGCVIPYYLRDKWRLLNYADKDGLKLACNKQLFDIAHYDSDKSYNGRKNSYPVIWSKIRLGGFFISDDVSDNLAFKEFCEYIKNEPIIIKFYDNRKTKYVGVLKK